MRLPRRPLPWILAGAGLLVLCCGGLVVIGLVVGPPKTKATSGGARAISAPASPAAPTSASPSPRASPSPAASSRPAVKPAPSSAAPADPDHRLCRQTSDGATFYVWITSAVHRFDACAGGTVDPRTIDDLLLGTPGMDRRCIVDSNDYLAAHQGIVGVYSDTAAADLAAARGFCAANGGTDSG